jgi:hypothetical protein
MTHLTLRHDGDYRYLSAPEGEVAKLALSYDKDARIRGIYLRISTVTIKHDTYGTSESFMLFGDKSVRVLCAQLPRKNPKVFLAIAEKLDPIIPALIESYLKHRDSALREFEGAALALATEAMAA